MRAPLLLALLGLASASAGAPEPLLAPSGPLYLGPFDGPGAAPAHGKERVRVDPESGDLYIQTTLLELPVAGPDLRLEQIYSQGQWSWSFQDSLLLEGQSITRSFAGDREVFEPDEQTRRMRLESGALAAWMPGSRLGGGRLVKQDAQWALQDGSQTRHYDEQGRLLSIQDEGGSTELSWDELGRPTKLQAGDTVIRLFFDGEGQLSVISGASGQEIYVQHKDGLLLGVSGQDRPRSRYFYDEQGHLSGILWADGSRLRIDYDDEQRVTELAGPGTWNQRYIWTAQGLNVQDGLGLSRQITRNSRGETLRDAAGRSVSLRRDAQGQLMGWTDPAGLELRLSRDDAGRITAIEGPGGRRYRLEYSAGALVSVRDAMGNSTIATRGQSGQVSALSDAMGRSTTFSRNPQGQITAVGPSGHPTRFSLDSAGRITTLHWPTGSRSKLSYDNVGRLRSMADPGGQEILIRSRNKGRVQEILSRGGARWLFSHDRVGRLVELVEPSGRTWRLDRDPTGRLRTLIRDNSAVLSLGWRVNGMLSSLTDALDGTWGLPQDPTGRPRGLVEPDGSTTKLGWNPLGELVQVQDRKIRRDPRGFPLEDGRNTWSWDAAGALSGVSGPGVALKLQRQAGGRVRRLDIGEQQIRLTRDAGGRVIGLEDGEQTLAIQRNGLGDWVALQGEHDVQIERDDRGLVVVRSVDDMEQRLLRDSEGDVVRYTASDGRALSVARHPDGSPRMVRFPDGHILRIEEGPTLWSQVLEDPSGNPVLDQRIQIDAMDREVARESRGDWGYSERSQHHSPRGQVVAVEESNGAWFWAPDAVTRSGGGTLNLDAQGQAVSIKADPNPLSPHELSPHELGPHPLGAALTYQRDSAGCLQGLAGPGGSVEVGLDGLGRVRSLQTPDGLWEVEWNLLGELARITPPSGSPWELSWVLGELVQVQQGQERIEVLGNHTLGWVWLDGVESLGLVLDHQGTPQLALGQADPLRWSPLGHGSVSPLPLGPYGTWRLYQDTLLVDRYGAWEPQSGARLCSLAPPAFPASPSGFAWDPEPWMPSGPWADPLALLVAMGELEPWFDEEWASLTLPVGVLPGWPVATGTKPLPLAPPQDALPLSLSPLETALLSRVRPPVSAVDPKDILRILISSEYQEQPIFSTPSGAWIPSPTPRL
ncbi:MAG: YD repeat-containing protein [Cognaticolwellia sp.]|jgi:YD repeat-containing protein